MKNQSPVELRNKTCLSIPLDLECDAINGVIVIAPFMAFNMGFHWGGGFKHLLFSPLPGEMIQLDYFLG